MTHFFTATKSVVTRRGGTLYSILDPALDPDCLDEYQDTLQGERFLTGSKPISFDFRIVGVEEADEILVAAASKARRKGADAFTMVDLAYFEASVTAVRNVPVEGEDGEVVDLLGVRRLEVPPGVRFEIGGYIRRICTERIPGFFELSLPKS